MPAAPEIYQMNVRLPGISPMGIASLYCRWRGDTVLAAQVEPYPAWRMKFAHSFYVMASRADLRAIQRISAPLAAADGSTRARNAQPSMAPPISIGASMRPALSPALNMFFRQGPGETGPMPGVPRAERRVIQQFQHEGARPYSGSTLY